MATTRTYIGETIDIIYDAGRCIHVAECVRGLPAVFDTARRPWIQPDQAGADATVAVVLRCPSGALHYERKDGGPGETAPDTNEVMVAENGPLYVRGDISILTPDGRLFLKDTRVALCRCGASAHKPFCDNSHLSIEFSHDGRLGTHGLSQGTVTTEAGSLVISLATNGPLLLQGAATLIGKDGETAHSRRRVALCRCGGSGNKPFCDGTHTHIGFQS